MKKIFDVLRRVARSNAPGADHGRERHRQGGRRQDDPPAVAPRRDAVRRLQLRRDLADPDRERALRPRAGLVHRRRQAPRRILRGGQRRHALSRRDHRDGLRAPGQAAARARGEDRAARRRVPGHPRRRAARLRHEPRPAGGHPRRQAARGPLLPLERASDRAADAGRAARGHPAARRALPQADRGAGEGGRVRLGPARARDAAAVGLAGQRPRAAQRRAPRLRHDRRGARSSPDVVGELLPEVVPATPVPAAVGGPRAKKKPSAKKA